MNSGDIGDLVLLVDEDRQQRAATVLVDVAYVIEAQFRADGESRARTTTRASISIRSTAAPARASASISPASGRASFPRGFA